MCRELGVPWIPGALTPTEIEAAWRAGAAIVKLLPRPARRPAVRTRRPRDACGRAADGHRRRRCRETPTTSCAAGAVAVGADSSRARAVYDAVRARRMRAAVVGTGFIGVVHVEALRRLGIDVAGVVGSSPEPRAREAGPAGAVRELRGAARRRQRRRRPHHDAEPPPLPAGEGRARGRQARRLREAARAHLAGDGGARAAGRARAASCTARTTTSASTGSAARRATGCAAASSAACSTSTAATSRTGC